MRVTIPPILVKFWEFTRKTKYESEVAMDGCGGGGGERVR